MYTIIKELFSDTLKAALGLFKIMIPVSILVKLLELTGGISFLGDMLTPLMESMNLPGEIGLVWATTMLTNIYGGMLVYFSMPIHLSVAQISVMSMLILGAHTLPVELRVAHKAGCSLFVMFLIRFGCALLSAYGLVIIYNVFGLFSYEPRIDFQFLEHTTTDTWQAWVLGELIKYAKITGYIFCLLALMRLLKYIGVIDLITRMLKPALAVLGISKDVIPIAVIGSTLGILYGGALILKESEERSLDKMEVFYAMTLMGLCHSLIEDSILMMSLGAHYSGVFIFRMIFAFLMTWLIVKGVRLMPEEYRRKFLLTK